MICYETKYTKLTTIKGLFYNCGFDEATEYDDEDFMFHPNLLSKLIALTDISLAFAYLDSFDSVVPIHPTAFNGQYMLITIREIFKASTKLGGTVPHSWFQNCLGTITDAYGAFALTKITTVEPTFMRADSSTANTKLSKVSRMFYGCSYITSTLPVCNNSSAFTAINYASPSEGYEGYCYGATNAANYSSFTGGWTNYQNYG